MKLENLDLTISVIKGAAAALDMINSEEVANLEQTELFQVLTSHNLAQLESDVSSYVKTLEQVKAIIEKNGGELPADSPSIRQQLIAQGEIGQGRQNPEDDSEFRTALSGVFGGFDIFG